MRNEDVESSSRSDDDNDDDDDENDDENDDDELTTDDYDNLEDDQDRVNVIETLRDLKSFPSLQSSVPSAKKNPINASLFRL